MKKEIYYCEKCKVREIPKPVLCCSGFECACGGMPEEPPLCDICSVKFKLYTEGYYNFLKGDNNE